MIIQENIRTTILFAYLTSFLARVCELGFNILVFKQFSVETVGTYGLIMSIATFFNFALDLGLNQTLIREFSQRRVGFSEAVLGSLALRVPVASIGIIILVAWSYYSPTLSQDWLPLSLALLASILMTQRTLATSWLRANDGQTMANIIGVLLPLGKLAGGILLIKLNQFHLVIFFGAVLLVEGLVTSLSYFCTGKLKLERIKAQSLSFDLFKESVKLLWKPGVVIFLIGLCAVLQNRLDWILVYTYVSKTELAYYSLANKLYEFFVTFVGVAIGTCFPWICKFGQTKDANPTIVLGTKALTFGSVFLAALVALYSPNILRYFWGNKYEPANSMIFLIMYGAILLPVCAIPYYYLVACGQEKYYLVIMVAATLVQTGANLILIPQYGGVGASCGMIILNVTISFTTILLSYKFKELQFVGLRRIFIYSVMMLVVLGLLKWQQSNDIINLIVFNAFNLLFGVTILFTKDEWFYLMQKFQLA